MRIDRYTKVLLTLIAAALVWIGVGGPSLLPHVEAQAGPTRVVIVGYEVGAPGSGLPLPLPVRVTSSN